MNQRPGGDGLARQETGIGRIDPPCLENPMRRQQQCLTFKRESWKSLREGTEKRKILRSDSHISSAPRKTARLSRIQNPKGQNPLRLPFAPFRLIFRLEKTRAPSLFQSKDEPEGSEG